MKIWLITLGVALMCAIVLIVILGYLLIDAGITIDHVSSHQKFIREQCIQLEEIVIDSWNGREKEDLISKFGDGLLIKDHESELIIGQLIFDVQGSKIVGVSEWVCK